MHDEPAPAAVRVAAPRAAEALQRGAQPRLHRPACRVARFERHPPVGGLRADRAHQRELARHFVPHLLIGLGLRDAVGQQPVRVLSAMREPQRNAGEPAHHRGRQRALAIDGEDHRRVETRGQQPVDHVEIGDRIGRRVRVLDPWRVVRPHVVDHRQMRAERRARARREQRQMPAVAAFLQRAQCRRRHQHVAEIVEPHAQNAARAVPRGRAHCRTREP
ncbi:hypothetical protein FEP73_02428 [Burkholderia multivorans]|nr:hypothetical protein [Burkholderia multivorans]